MEKLSQRQPAQQTSLKVHTACSFSESYFTAKRLKLWSLNNAAQVHFPALLSEIACGHQVEQTRFLPVVRFLPTIRPQKGLDLQQ